MQSLQKRMPSKWASTTCENASVMGQGCATLVETRMYKPTPLWLCTLTHSLWLWTHTHTHQTALPWSVWRARGGGRGDMAAVQGCVLRNSRYALMCVLWLRVQNKPPCYPGQVNWGTLHSRWTCCMCVVHVVGAVWRADSHSLITHTHTHTCTHKYRHTQYSTV